ncbi:MAG: hypothetical protein AAF211_02900 [Myxococcota bacterium]
MIDPWGTVLAELTDDEGFVLAEVDLAEVHDVRRRMPIASHRRL